MNEEPPSDSGVVDLARVRAALATLDALVASGALDPDRTARWMAGDLEEGPLMTTLDNVPTSLRCSRELLDRAEALIPRLAELPDVAAMAGPRGVSRAVVLRLAVERGISELEAGVSPGTPPRDPRALREGLEMMRAHVDRLLADVAAMETDPSGGA
jgi:hypothetical protein